MLRVASSSMNIVLTFKIRIFSSSHQNIQSLIVCQFLRQLICVDTTFDRGNFIFDSAVRATWLSLRRLEKFTFLNSRQSERTNLRIEFSFHDESTASFVLEFQRKAKSMIQNLHSWILHVAIAKLNNDDLSRRIRRSIETLLDSSRRQILLRSCFKFDQLIFFNCFWSWSNCLKFL